jgi:hypothetical protein
MDLCSCSRRRARGIRQGVRCASRSLCAASLWACFVLSSVEARAENKGETAKASSTGAASAKFGDVTPAVPHAPAHAESAELDPAPPNSEAAAETAYRQAQAKYAKNDVRGALESMRESFRLCQRPELLYNLAVLERELQECRSALDDYTSYLQQVPQGRYRQAAELASTELGRECPAVVVTPSAAQPPAAPPLTTKSEPPPAPDPSQNAVSRPDSPYWIPPRVVGWSAVTAGVLAGGAALYFLGAAVSERSDFSNSVDTRLVSGGLPDMRLQDRQHRDQRLAQGLAVSGGALVTGGILVLIFGPRDRQQARARAQIQVQPGRLDARFTQSF